MARARVQTPPADARVMAPGLVPFTSAAHEHTEQFDDRTVTPGAAATQVGPIDVPAYGYIRHIWLLVESSGGTLGAGTLSADYPWNLFQSLTLSDVNGAPIFGPMSGYSALWANILGGYAGGAPDPRVHPDYVGTINSVFAIRIPVEISHRTGFGALANQNSAANYKLSYTINPSATMFSVAPTTVPAVRIRAVLEAWSLPNERDVLGRPQAQVPPRHGTTQYWSYFNRSTAAGSNTVLLPRVGNLIRNVIVIARTAAGARSDTVFPDPAELTWDARSIRRDPQRYITGEMRSAVPDLTARDAGVFAYTFDRSDHGVVGDDDPTFWLPTVQSSRLELDGSAAAAGSWEVITNDVAPVEVSPEERFVETSETGFTPAGIGAPVRAA